MPTKYDNIISELGNVNISLAKIEGHLKELNGRVVRNMKDIEDNRKEGSNNIKRIDERLDNQDKQIWKLVGGFGIIMAIVTVMINYAVNVLFS